MKGRRVPIGLLVLWLLGPLPASGRIPLASSQEGGSPTAEPDAIGYAYMAVGVPWDRASSTGDSDIDTGAVNMLYSSFGGLSATGDQWWGQDSLGIAGTGEAGDQFGSTLAAGDFNGDGDPDLAVGVPHEDANGTQDTGGVNVLYGSGGRLSATGDQWWSQDSPGISGTAEADDQFGKPLAAGDFNGDGCADLAVGVPWEDANGTQDTGGVNVLYGSVSGLSATDDQWWSQDSANIWGIAEADDLFGFALAVGDFDGDGYADLAVGVPHEGFDGIARAGGVNVLYGSAAGLSATGNQWWSQDSADIRGVAEASDYFGNALAAGDLNGDGYADLAVGVPDENFDDIAQAGGVNVLYGSVAGLSATDNQWWTQDSDGIWGVAETYDLFGSVLTVGDFDGDGYADLAVGVPQENFDGMGDAGGVNVLYGSAAGLSAADDQWWSQDSADILGEAESADCFGFALAAGDLNGDGYADLAVGVPHEADADGTLLTGGVNVLYGAAAGLSATGNQWWSQDSPGILGVAEAFDAFGHALAISDWRELEIYIVRVYLPLIVR